MVEVTHFVPVQFGREGVWGGGERWSVETAKAMAPLVRTRLVSFGPRRERQALGPLEVEILPTRLEYRSHLNPLSELLPLQLLRTRVVHAHQYETVLTTQCLLLGRGVLRKPVFATDHGGDAPNGIRKLGLHRLVTGFIAITDFGVSCYPELRDRASIAYSGVDVDRFSPDGGDRERQVMFVGRLMPHKGIDVLIRAMDPDVPLHVFGRPYDPAYRDELLRLARGKRVTIHEEAGDEELIEAYRRSRVSVLPSVHRSERAGYHPKAELLGTVLLEAMACGTPVVCTRVGGMPEVVRDGETGFVVPENDPEPLRDRIRELLDDDARWRSMSAAAVEHVRTQFTWDRVAERCLEAYSAAG